MYIVAPVLILLGIVWAVALLDVFKIVIERITKKHG